MELHIAYKLFFPRSFSTANTLKDSSNVTEGTQILHVITIPASKLSILPPYLHFVVIPEPASLFYQVWHK